MQRLKQPKMNVNSLKKKLIRYEQILNWLEVTLKSTEKKNEVILTVDSWSKVSTQNSLRPKGPIFYSSVVRFQHFFKVKSFNHLKCKVCSFFTA